MRTALKPSRQTLLLLTLSLLAGAGAAWFARQHIEQKIQQAQIPQQGIGADAEADAPPVLRVVAAHDLAAGVVLDAQQVAVRQFPADLVASDSVSPEQYADVLQGQALTSPLRAGDAILGVHVRPPVSVTASVPTSGSITEAALEPFSASLAKGRRAVTLPIDEVNSAAGLLAPGDLIDLYVSFEHQHRRITAPLLQGVRVLATGQQTDQKADPGSKTAAQSADSRLTHRGRYSTVTLETSPEDAIKLVAARQGGTLTALLRQRGDEVNTPQAVRGDLASLLGLSTEQAPPAAPRRIAVIYGDQTVSIPAVAAAAIAPNPNPSPADAALPGMPELVSAWLADAQRRGLPLMSSVQQEAGHAEP